MGVEQKETYELTTGEFAEFQRLREEAHQGFQRVMNPHNGEHAPQLKKVKFDGKNKEEFLLKFGHLAEAYGVAETFYTDYGLHQPSGQGGMGCQGLSSFSLIGKISLW